MPPDDTDSSSPEVIEASSLEWKAVTGHKAGEEPHSEGRILTDPDDLLQRSLCASFWYGDMAVMVDNLARHTGHEFGPVWKFRSPVEILEEQLEFWKEFMETTDEIARKFDQPANHDESEGLEEHVRPE